jgi:hypothetical protein
MNMTNEENIDPLLDIENADFLELSASQEEILVKSLQRASTETHTAVGNTGQTRNGKRLTFVLSCPSELLQKQIWISVIMVIVNVNFTNIVKIVDNFHGNEIVCMS